MNMHLGDFQHKLRTDARFKKRIKKFVIIGAVVVLLLIILIVVGIIAFFSTIAGLVLTHAPALFEVVFNYGREFAADFMVQDLNALLQPLTQNPYVAEMQSLITQYAEQLRVNPAIDFQNFRDFIDTVKTSIIDNQITGNEVELARQFLVN